MKTILINDVVGWFTVVSHSLLKDYLVFYAVRSISRVFRLSHDWVNHSIFFTSMSFSEHIIILYLFWIFLILFSSLSAFKMSANNVPQWDINIIGNVKKWRINLSSGEKKRGKRVAYFDLTVNWLPNVINFVVITKETVI